VLSLTIKAHKRPEKNAQVNFLIILVHAAFPRLVRPKCR